MDNISNKTKDITKIGIFAALVYLATFFLKIPSVNGYTHLGDAFIFLAVIIMGYKRGALAGAIGGALSDILGGYLIWVIPTFFIKSIMAIIMGIFIKKCSKLKYSWLVGAILGGLFQIVAYTIFSIIFFGLEAGIAAIPGFCIQTACGLIFVSIFYVLLLKTNSLEKLKEL
ncbi:MAG: ECF transporter S component [Clostridiales bacterium]|nr:ECF transporter S component [Clostridiales bacterium]MDY2729036.1 ECF transporter S component [Clostridium sp.]NLK22458.1 ECF transporter S component [Clostridiales bacterium]